MRRSRSRACCLGRRKRVRRRQLTFIMATSLVLCVANLSVWVWTHHRYEMADRTVSGTFIRFSSSDGDALIQWEKGPDTYSSDSWRRDSRAHSIQTDDWRE